MDEIYNRYVQRYNVFLAEDINAFDWEGFFDRYFFESHYIVEAVDYDGRESITRFNDSSFKDTYIIYPTDNLKFKLTLSFIQASNKLNTLDKHILNCKMFIRTDACVKLQQVYQHLHQHADKYICDVDFVDAQGRTNVTGEVDRYAFYVLKSIESTLETVLLQSDNNNICTLTFCSSKAEQKRHLLYMQMLKRVRIRAMFKDIIEDTVSSDTYNTIYVLL
jgi:hypothetical protein